MESASQLLEWQKSKRPTTPSPREDEETESFTRYWQNCVTALESELADSYKVNPPANAGASGDTGSIPGLRRSPEGGNANLLQYSCLGNPMERGAWWAIVHGVTKSQT